MQVRSSSRHAGGKRPPWVATPTTAVVGPRRKRVVDRGHDRNAALRLARPRRVEQRDDGALPVREHAARGLPVVRVAREALSEYEQLLGHPRPGLSAGTCTPSRSSTPGHGSSASSRLPSRSTWSHRGATQQPAAIARPDSTMQPSMTPSPSARAACTIRSASRIPPDFASLMLIPCAISGAARHVAEPVAVLVDVDRDRRALLQRRARRRHRPAAAARSTRRRARPAAAAPRAPPRATTTRSRRPAAAGRSRRARHARARRRARRAPPSLSFSRLKRPPTFSARRAMSSGSPSQIVQDVGGPAAGRPSRRWTGWPASLPARSWSAPSIAARAANSRSGSRRMISSSANGSSPTSSACSSTYARAEARRLVVALDRSALAEAARPFVAQLDDDDVRGVGRVARDRERLGELERDDPGRDLHG